jgi:hypothetical protein
VESIADSNISFPAHIGGDDRQIVDVAIPREEAILRADKRRPALILYLTTSESPSRV